MPFVRIFVAVALFAMVAPFAIAQDKTPLTLIVMDPLSAPLSCDCVKGYAQRDYNKLAAHLEKQLNRPVKVHFSESLTAALQKKTEGKADLIIGKESVIRYQAKENKLAVMPIASLTGKDGKTTMTGLFVLPSEDKAVTLSDIKGYRILFGPAHADEKHKFALDLMKVFEVPPPTKVETCNSCSDGATKVLAMFKNGEKAATVISSYAEPLLEGCGTIKKGDLRIIGETDAMPFVVAFVSERVAPADCTAIERALMTVGSVPDLCTALETKKGFVPFETAKKK
jgi:ABC-type phosphate/phosphonate transport system substrate-binding protein